MGLYIGDIKEHTIVEGPFKRYALWLSGCSIRCEDCCNPHLFNRSNGTQTSIENLKLNIQNSKHTHNIEGISLLGGEPLDQSEELVKLLSAIQSENLGVMLYSGYYLSEIEKDPIKARVLQFVDLLVDGPYLPSQRQTSRRWVGSSNQNIHFLTNRYQDQMDEFQKGNQVELVLKRNSLSVHGFPVLNLKRVKK
ncbi:MAG: 4Fe-4S cluster-binding domain-containing protein [Candidatus Cloacimonetes bacterium]|nr:4Fe-4S cluster-binding domain-containing protein [Candidatus Cloacimonadota bacterium]